MKPKDQKKSKASSCWNCALRKKGGINAFGICTWFDKPKEIPSNIIDKGCKFWRDEFAQEVIERFDGELIIRRNI